MINPRRPFVGRGLIAASAGLLLVAAIAGQVSALKPPAPTSTTAILSIDPATCQVIVRYDWSGFTGGKLLAEVLLFEQQAGLPEEAKLGLDLRDVSGRLGTFTAELNGLSPVGEPERPLYAKGSLWTLNGNTRMIAGSLSVSDSVLSTCQG